MNTAKVLIVSHDAGGAYLLSKWCRDWISRVRFSFYVSGPAIKIFNQAIPSANFTDHVDWSNINQVITSTGWQTDFEINAIQTAKKKRIYVVSYLDHWANYTERFLCEGKMVYPDEIWVADDEAMALAKNAFDSKVSRYRKIRNRHFCQIKSNIDHSVNKNTVLICLEPLRSEYSLIEAYDVLIDFLIGGFSSTTHIVIRDHPSNTETKLDYLVDRLDAYFNVTASENSLEQDLSSCRVVIGYQSSVLVYAIALGIDAYSYFPLDKMEPILPHVDITYISTLSGQKVDI